MTTFGTGSIRTTIRWFFVKYDGPGLFLNQAYKYEMMEMV